MFACCILYNMKLTKEEEITVETYNTNAEKWATEHSSPRFWVEEMGNFNKLLPSGKILEIGSGSGRDAKELMELGYDYTGIDVSDGLLREARKVNPNAEFIKMSLYELNFPENNFEGFWSSATLLHIPKNRIDEALNNIYTVVKEDGIGFISIKKGQGERIEKDEPEMEGTQTRLFTYYSDEEFRDVLKRNNFEILDFKERPTSERTTWLIYFVKVKK